MKDYKKIVLNKKVDKVIKNLKLNNMNGYFIELKNLKELLDTFIDDEMTVSVGGSMTLFETDTIEYLRKRDINFLDRYKDGLSKEDIKIIYRGSFFTDVYLSSTNAITEDGELYNVDGNGNRVAAMIYGPDKVVIIAGVNKIVKDLDDAIKRNREVAAPINVQRLNKNTPCRETGYCMDCKSKDKICRNFTVINSQADKDRIHVILIDENLGY